MSGKTWRNQEPLPHRDAVLQEKAADLIDDRGPLSHQAIAHAMQRLEIALFVRFRWYAPHPGTLHGFSDRMRISKVILVGLPERLGIDRRHLSHVVVEGKQFAGMTSPPTVSSLLPLLQSAGSQSTGRLG
jgi:hypothetical protein